MLFCDGDYIIIENVLKDLLKYNFYQFSKMLEMYILFCYQNMSLAFWLELLTYLYMSYPLWG